MWWEVTKTIQHTREPANFNLLPVDALLVVTLSLKYYFLIINTFLHLLFIVPLNFIRFTMSQPTHPYGDERLFPTTSTNDIDTVLLEIFWEIWLTQIHELLTSDVPSTIMLELPQGGCTFSTRRPQYLPSIRSGGDPNRFM